MKKFQPAGALAAACLLAAAPPAHSGAWMQAHGKGFAAASATWRYADTGRVRELSFYADYGITPKLTFGLDLNDTGTRAEHALAFLRLPVGQWGPHNVALETAAGFNTENGTMIAPMQKYTLSYGRGFEVQGMSGWLAVDAANERRGTSKDSLWKLDATVGLNRPGKAAPMLQIETAKAPGQPLFYALTPALRLPLEGGQEVILGLEHRKTDVTYIGFEIGLWHRF